MQIPGILAQSYKSNHLIERMAKRFTKSSINWAEFEKKVPPDQKAKFFAFKAKSDAYLRRYSITFNFNSSQRRSLCQILFLLPRFLGYVGFAQNEREQSFARYLSNTDMSIKEYFVTHSALCHLPQSRMRYKTRVPELKDLIFWLIDL